MYNDFDSFYDSTGSNGGKMPKWRQLEAVLRIRQAIYPTNNMIRTYYHENFKNKTSSMGRSKWHTMDKLVFVWVTVKHAEKHGRDILELQREDFAQISSILNVSEALLQSKWLKLIRPYVKKIPWSEEEDKLLLDIMKGKNCILTKQWTEVALRLFEGNVSKVSRTAKQVRERWANYINPGLIRSEWTEEEDERLLTLVDKKGKRWSEIGRILSRTENNVKNHYNSLLTTRVPKSVQWLKADQKKQPVGVKVATFRPITLQKIEKPEKICGFRQICMPSSDSLHNYSSSDISDSQASEISKS